MKNKERKKKKGRARIKNKKQQPLVSRGSPGALPGALPVCWLPPLTPGKPSRQGGTDSASSLTTLLAAAAAAKLLQLYPTLCDPIDGSPPGSCPWDSPGKNTGVGCHCLLQCMRVKSESEVAQSCPTPSDLMDCSPPGPSVHGIFQARVLEWLVIAFSEVL